MQGKRGWLASLPFGAQRQRLLMDHPHALAAHRYLIRSAAQVAQHLPLQGLLCSPFDPRRFALPVLRLAVHRSSVNCSSYPPTVSANGVLSFAPFLYSIDDVTDVRPSGAYLPRGNPDMARPISGA
jgi:hypothetical protein